MNEPTITCPACKSEIKLTESLVAPLIEATRQQYEQEIAKKEAEVAKREAALTEQKADLERAKAAIDQQVEAKVKSERERIAAEEAKKARLLLATDLEQKDKDFADLQEVLKERDIKLAAAQEAQAQLIRKQRELDDAKREMDLTIEKRVQESLGKVRDQAKKDAEEGLKLKVVEKEQAIASMQHQIEDLERKAEQGSQQIAKKEAEVTKREAALTEQKADLERAKAAIDQQVEAKVKSERERIAAEEGKKARLLLATDLEQKAKELVELQVVLKERDTKLAEAQKAQAELIRRRRELDDAKREMDLTIEKRVQESLGTVRDKATKDAEEGMKLKVVEKEQAIASMQRQIEELKRKAEQGSQQLQGEAQEIDLERTLQAKFPLDLVDPVPKGEFGGDILQRVTTPTGQQAGTILWESKRTKNWSDGWLAKLRGDQRAAKAEIAIIVSRALPKDIDSFDLVDDVWVTDPSCAIPVAIALRHSLIELSIARQAGEGQQTKMELVYRYLTGSRFRHRVQAIVEKFTDMQQDLDKERKTMTRLWAKREEQIRGVIESTAGMYGDLQGIAGRTLQEIEGLDMKLLPETTDQ